MSDFDTFLAGAAGAMPGFPRKPGSKPVLAVDLHLSGEGVALNRKSTENPLGARRPSVLQLVRDMPCPLAVPCLTDFDGLADFFSRIDLLVEDASPDTVTSVLFFAARQAGVAIPDDVWARWEPVITSWEQTGTVDDPAVSWPALAAALAHSMFGPLYGTDGGDEDRKRAWGKVLPFAIEALRAGYHPGDVPPTAQGPCLVAARAALQAEKARYERKLAAQQVHQLSLPVIGTTRRRLVDALFTTESEFSGAMKVFARNDRQNAPLGHGFSVLVLERPGLRETEPHNWMTISLDPRVRVHLLDLWRELERREAAAWEKERRERPARNAQTRLWTGENAPSLDEQKFHQQWYLAEEASLLASPRMQTVRVSGEETAPFLPGTLLKTADVWEALFQLYDPFQQVQVHQAANREAVLRLVDVPDAALPGGRRILKAWWPPDEPLPHPSSQVPAAGLFPSAIRAMAARTCGAKASAAIMQAPDAEEITLVAAGNAVAVITDEGVFLLDSGRRGRDLMVPASKIARQQAEAATTLDRIQDEVSKRLQRQADEWTSWNPISAWLDLQRFCTRHKAVLVQMRGHLDLPLSSREASLQDYRDALACRWNTRKRLDEIAQELEWLRQTGRDAEELRVFHTGRVAAGFGLAIVTADATASRVKEFIVRCSQPACEFPMNHPEAVSFSVMFALSWLIFFLASKFLRAPFRPKER